MPNDSPYPPIGDYAFIADSNSAALVSRSGSIDWCCMERIDSGSCFGRLLDWENGGYCSIFPTDHSHTISRQYVDGTLVLETNVRTEGGEARLYDCFTLPAGKEAYSYRQLLRVVEGVRGYVELGLKVVPRFDYGDIEPWIRQEGVRLYSAIGGNDGLLISSDADIDLVGDHELAAPIKVHAGERTRLSIQFTPPERLDYDPPEVPDHEELDHRLQETINRWRDWSSGIRFEGPYKPGVRRSAIAIKGLMNDMTGAVVAAATTSLPESWEGDLNWDYRYSWVRDSFFSVRSLAEIGFEGEAEQFRRFIERSAAGHAEKLQIMYGVGGERRLTEETLGYLEGYRGVKPVRIGNSASLQFQLDAYGELLELAWRWHLRGNSPDDDYWRLILRLVKMAAERWQEPDHGLWEIRGEPRHYVHSKVMCWVALDRGLRLAKESMRKAPEQRWRKVREEIKEAVEAEGYDEERGVFVQTFGGKDLDAALLLLPRVGFVVYKDDRMVRTTEAIREELDNNGLLMRFRREEWEEGAFLACSYWLVECLAYQGRLDEARTIFDRAVSSGNDLGLFSEEYDTQNAELLGNFPQGLTHFSHITAAVALAELTRNLK